MSVLHPDVQLSVEIGALIGRDKYTRDQAVIDAKIADLRKLAGVRTDILNRDVGSWVGYYDSPETKPLIVALLAAFPGAVPWISLGQERRGRVHGTYEKR
jgi:hypothetical protein